MARTAAAKQQKTYSALLALQGDVTQQIAIEATGAELLVLRHLHGKGGVIVCLSDVKEVGVSRIEADEDLYLSLEQRFGKPAAIEVFGHRANARIPTEYPYPAQEGGPTEAEPVEA